MVFKIHFICLKIKNSVFKVSAVYDIENHKEKCPLVVCSPVPAPPFIGSFALKGGTIVKHISSLRGGKYYYILTFAI